MERHHPSYFEPQLTDEVVSFFAQHMLNIYTDILDVLSTEDDSNYGRGTSIFDRTRNRFLNLIMKRQCPVDVHLVDGSLKFIFQIGNANIRFLKDDFDNPKKKKYLMQQLQSMSLFPLDDQQPQFWRFILNEPKTLDDEPIVVFAGYNLANEVVAYWDSSSITDLNYIHLVEPETPNSVELGSPLVEDPDHDSDKDDDSEAVNN
ncbi:hypothetical protein GCM10023206_06740 [Acinetobacter puyangensis]|uniref:Uncharacterized protein n=1 Tax=Acinetobacter puyangensis TaxID=1096779 RepID=A0A240E666_9GAMM|nr:hypothetical protein [Acinetobacter puyangensis]SNX44247.1 hypothetical protein SAMN05421731_102408 [Acinetobacter puyangensis]